MSVLVTHAIITVTIQIVLLATYARAARRAFQVRHNGTRTMAHTALPRPVLASTLAYGMHLLFTRTLLLRWVRKTIQHAETSTQPHEDHPSLS